MKVCWAWRNAAGWLAALQVYRRCSRRPAVMSRHSLVGSKHAVAGAAMSAAAAACRAGAPVGMAGRGPAGCALVWLGPHLPGAGPPWQV